MRPDELHKLFGKTLTQVLQEKDVSEERLEKLPGILKEAVPEVTDDVAKLLFASLTKRAPAMLRNRRRYLKQFQKRHFRLWKEGLDLLESFLVTAYEIGENFNLHYREDAARSQNYLFEALTRLHARAVHVGFEVLSLLSSGFADGAHARWRTAHEIAVVSNFLACYGQDAARRYLEHEAIESYKAMLQFQDYADAIGYEKYPDQEISELKTVYDELCTKHGKSFGTQYGWATEALKNKRPNFFDIEKASRLDHLRPYYRMASHNVHANPKGIKFRLGLPEDAEILLAGPSNYGLADPAHGISISVLQATVPMLNTQANIDVIVMEKILQMYVDDIGEVFMNVHNCMKEYDHAQQENPADS